MRICGRTRPIFLRHLGSLPVIFLLGFSSAVIKPEGKNPTVLRRLCNRATGCLEFWDVQRDSSLQKDADELMHGYMGVQRLRGGDGWAGKEGGRGGFRGKHGHGHRDKDRGYEGNHGGHREQHHKQRSLKAPLYKITVRSRPTKECASLGERT